MKPLHLREACCRGGAWNGQLHCLDDQLFKLSCVKCLLVVWTGVKFALSDRST